MPTYLCHGFRWQRPSIRIYVIVQDVGDASPEWIIAPEGSQSILKSFYEVFTFLPYCSPERGRYTPTRDADSDPSSRAASYRRGNRSQSRGRGRSQSHSTSQSRSRSRPRQQQPLPDLPAKGESEAGNGGTASEDGLSAQSWSAVKLLEEYDPRDLDTVSRPYAYVADYAVRIDLSCSIVDEIARYEQQQLQSAHPAISIPSKDSSSAEGQPGWFEELRDQLQRGEEIRWYVVVNGDEVRDYRSEEPIDEGAKQGPHHRQHTHQQLIFEDGDQERVRVRERSPALATTNGNANANAKPNGSRTLGSRISFNALSAAGRPKTLGSKGSGGGKLRRCFGSGKDDVCSS
ncbi:hypothetical protein C8A03DRAFT_45163 [Achaetomium macrosporum]|uniref:Developmental regulator protein n=1 Tax=Achaetomium macrosporum TaxID=79813 RepID=A0AAN7H675_9PEZI|nr:hypothetical protein C8A03DRAFT_45163 [Achaetomium macrosporum]